MYTGDSIDGCYDQINEEKMFRRTENSINAIDTLPIEDFTFSSYQKTDADELELVLDTQLEQQMEDAKCQ